MAEHWDVPIRKADALHIDQDGVALASKATYMAKKQILEGSPKRIAMLIPPTVETDVEAPLVTIYAKIGGETKQVTRKFVQLGSEPVKYTPPTTRGAALRIDTRQTIVMEIIKYTSDDKQWKDLAMKADELFSKYAKPILDGTRWADARPSRARPSIHEGKTTSMQAFIRIPEGKVSAFLVGSGMGNDMVFTRVFTERGKDVPRIYTNIWMDKCTLEEARLKARALPESDFYGLHANYRGIAARIMEADGPRLAPLLNGRAYSTGDRYIIQGVPRDCAWEDLVESLTTMEEPWIGFEHARMVYRRGAVWVVQVSSPPPALIIFLGDVVLALSKTENPKDTAVKPSRPKPTVSAWNAPPVCPPRREIPGNSMPRTQGKSDDDEDMNGDGDTAKNAREDRKKDDQPEEVRRSRSPHRQAPAASAASSRGPAPFVATDPRIDQLQAQMAEMQAQVVAMMQQMATMQGMLAQLMTAVQ